MKTIKIALIFFLCTFVAQAQKTYKHSLSGIKKVKIYTDTGVDLSVGNTNELIISNSKTGHQHKTDDHTNKSRKDKAKGLKALYSKGDDNTGIGFEITKDGSTLIVKDLESFMKRSGFKMKVSKNVEVYLNCGNLGHAKVNGITSEIEVKTNVGHIDLKNITGPATVRTNTGNITAIFTSVNQSNPVSLSTATGDVDVSLPTNTKADLSLKSTMGTVYTDFNFKVEKSKGLNPLGNPKKITTKLNNGGVHISLKSTTGNVYLRKK